MYANYYKTVEHTTLAEINLNYKNTFDTGEVHSHQNTTDYLQIYPYIPLGLQKNRTTGI